MGAVYYSICLDCKEGIELGKSPHLEPYFILVDGEAANKQMNLQNIISRQLPLMVTNNTDPSALDYYDLSEWIERQFLLNTFRFLHNAHRIWTGNEYRFDELENYDDCVRTRDGYICADYKKIELLDTEFKFGDI